MYSAINNKFRKLIKDTVGNVKSVRMYREIEVGVGESANYEFLFSFRDAHR